ncbi:hypothetical protein PIROE2DRAFT_5870 [Piromyces sp. E2]|nr:hypothetical protein PIROE2DRAFT_5870 [Piromyces sp. E2]|eukprot:OUM66774.1 hypothetical protein PIROE2DRAFT_5870 [Piromyces sp. E2]
MSVNDSSSVKFEDSQSSPTSGDMRPGVQRNGRSLKSMIFDSDEDKERYAKEYFSVQKIENQYLKYK